MSDGSEFIVKLNGIKLPNKIEARIAEEVRATVMRELAKLDLGNGLSARIPRKEWLGLWIEKFKGGILPQLRARGVNE